MRFGCEGKLCRDSFFKDDIIFSVYGKIRYKVCLEVIKLGFKKSASRSVGTYGIVIGPRAWAKYYIKHELIHYWQAENLGMIKMNYYPQWLIEGMAYSLSHDPRTTLDEPWETYREEFNNWYKQIDKNDLLIEIKAIGQESR